MSVAAGAQSWDTHHCKRLSGPIKTASHLSEGVSDLLVVLLLPVLGELDELCPADIMPGLLLHLPEHLLHHTLCRDALRVVRSCRLTSGGYLTSVVTAGQPQRGLSLLPVVADQQVLQRVAQGVAHAVHVRDLPRS